MEATEVTVEVPVKSLPEARRWYERLLGKPPELEPVPGIVEFKVGATWLQLAEGRVGQTDWTFRIGVMDVEGVGSSLRVLGIETTEVETVPNLISFFGFKDLDGNKLSFYQLL